MCVTFAPLFQVACFGANKEEAFLKSMLATGFKIPEKGILVSCQVRLNEPLWFELKAEMSVCPTGDAQSVRSSPQFPNLAVELGWVLVTPSVQTFAAFVMR